MKYQKEYIISCFLKLSIQFNCCFLIAKKEKSFFDTLLQNGILDYEPEFQERSEKVHGLDYDNPDFYTHNLNLPFPPKMNQLKKKGLL